jgi:hypothetical protein
MRQAYAVALVFSIGATMGSVGPTRAATACQPSSRIHAGALNVTLNNGDTTVVRVTGYPGAKPAAAAPPDVVIHVRNGVPVTIGNVAPGGAAVQIAPNITASVTVDASPKPEAAGTNAPTPQPSTRPGGPDDKLTATIKDERFASFTASPAPAASPGASGGAAAPVVEYTIKGQHPGDTKLIVAQGDECVAVGVHVRPAINDRFLASTGVAMSFVPKYAITATPAPAPNSGILVFKTENSAHRVAIPLLFNYRLSENVGTNIYGTVGFFANGSGSGLAYGLSVAREQYLLTFGLHSENITDFAPGVTNNAIVPAGMNTTITRRVTSPFFAVTFPTSFLTQLLGGTSANSSGGSSSGSQ